MYIDNNVNIMTPVGLRLAKNFTTRAENKQYALQKSCYSLVIATL